MKFEWFAFVHTQHNERIYSYYDNTYHWNCFSVKWPSTDELNSCVNWVYLDSMVYSVSYKAPRVRALGSVASGLQLGIQK